MKTYITKETAKELAWKMFENLPIGEHCPHCGLYQTVIFHEPTTCFCCNNVIVACSSEGSGFYLAKPEKDEYIDYLPQPGEANKNNNVNS